MACAVIIGATALILTNPFERLQNATGVQRIYPKDKLGYMQEYQTVVTLTQKTLSTLNFTSPQTWQPAAADVERAIQAAKRITPPNDAIIEHGLHHVTVANLECARQNLALALTHRSANAEQRIVVARYAMVCLRRALQTGEILIEKQT